VSGCPQNRLEAMAQQTELGLLDTQQGPEVPLPEQLMPIRLRLMLAFSLLILPLFLVIIDNFHVDFLLTSK
jgi:hypothetical protein